MCLAVFYNAQPRVPIYHYFLYYFGSLRIYIVSRIPIEPVNELSSYFHRLQRWPDNRILLINIRILQEATPNVYF